MREQSRRMQGLLEDAYSMKEFLISTDEHYKDADWRASLDRVNTYIDEIQKTRTLIALERSERILEKTL